MNKMIPGDPILQVHGSPVNSKCCRDKDTHFVRQFQIVFQAFSEKPKTMMMVEVETGIMRSNITRFVARMKRCGTITLVKTDLCPITKCNAGFYQTFPNPNSGDYLSAPISCTKPTDAQTSAFVNFKRSQDFSFNLFNNCTDYE